MSAFTVSDGAALHVAYVGLTTHLWMVTKGHLPRSAGPAAGSATAGEFANGAGAESARREVLDDTDAACFLVGTVTGCYPLVASSGGRPSALGGGSGTTGPPPRRTAGCPSRPQRRRLAGP